MPSWLPSAAGRYTILICGAAPHARRRLRLASALAAHGVVVEWASDTRTRSAKLSIETWELASYIVTVIGLPLAIGVFLYEQRKERENEDEEVYQLLSDNYQDFLKVALGHPELGLFSSEAAREDSAHAREKKLIIFNMLISLFERAYLLLYDPSMTSKQARRWSSWEDYMREWCRRADFREQLPRLLLGEDPEFVGYLKRIAHEEVRADAER